MNSPGFLMPEHLFHFPARIAAKSAWGMLSDTATESSQFFGTKRPEVRILSPRLKVLEK